MKKRGPKQRAAAVRGRSTGGLGGDGIRGRPHCLGAVRRGSVDLQGSSFSDQLHSTLTRELCSRAGDDTY